MRVTWSVVLARVADASMPRTRRFTPVRSSSAAKPAIIPACVEPVTVHTMIVSNVIPSAFSCSASSKAQLANPRPPSGCSDAPAGMGYGLPPDASTSARAFFHESRTPMSKPASSRRESAPIMRESRMLPTLSLAGSSHGTHLSCTRRAFRPRCAATAATWRVWLDWYPPIETSVSAPEAITSGTMYSSLRILLPP